MLRLLEHYVSVQGECDSTGTPTQFVRFAGCNLKCAGWPCDTPFAIFPKQYLKNQKLIPVRNPGGESLIFNILDQANETGAKNICLTGGEPLLQPTPDLLDLILGLAAIPQHVSSIEMFSNGTISYPPDIMRHCAIRMDWKLPGSHEDQSGPNWDYRVQNYYAMSEWNHHTIKFTVKDEADFETAMTIYDKYAMEDWPGSIYVGPVWNGDITAAEITDGILANKLPWRLNLQLHNFIWDPQERGR